VPGASYRFGPFVADRVRYQVLRDPSAGSGSSRATPGDDGRALELTPKLLDLLFHLLDHAGDLVTKETLLEDLWPGANVTDNALAQAVSELRDALGDEPASPRFIKTIARRGYRFIGPVETVRRAEEGAHVPPAARRVRETTSLEAHRAFSEGWLHLESLDVRETPTAIARFERAVAADPKHALAYTGLATAEFTLFESTRSDNEPAQDVLLRAIAHARDAVQLEPNLAEAHATLALVLTSAWQTAEAAAAARRAVALEPSNWRHLFRLGHATWGDERLRAATATLDAYPDFAFSYFQMAMVHVARGRLRDAETALRQGAAVQDRQIARGGRYPALGLHWLLGLVRLADGDAAEAIVELDREHRLAEPHRLYGREYAAHARLGRGAALLRSDRPRDAVGSFTAALELYPQHAPTLVGLALAHRAAGESAAADAAFAAADRGLATLTRTRPVEAALVRAQLLASRGGPGAGEDAVEALAALLTDAPPGFAGWTIPVEPLLSQLASNQCFAGVRAALDARAV